MYNTQTGQLYSGWEYKEDAQDQIDEIVEQGDENNDEPTDKADPQEVENVTNGIKGSDISDEENENTLTEDEKLEALSLIEKILYLELVLFQLSVLLN